jgi:hypothetical protein
MDHTTPGDDMSPHGVHAVRICRLANAGWQAQSVNHRTRYLLLNLGRTNPLALKAMDVLTGDELTVPELVDQLPDHLRDLVV